MSARLKELREKNARTVTTARAALDGVTDATPAERRAELEREFDAAMAEYDRIDAEIRRVEKLEGIEARERAAAEALERDAEEARKKGRPGADVRAPGAAQTEKAEVRSAFRTLLLGGVSALTEEQRAALHENGTFAPIDPEIRALTTGTGSSGGFTVPREFLAMIEKTMADWGPMLDPNAVTIMTTDGGNLLEMPSIDDTAVRGDQFAENADITDDGGVDPTFGQITLSAYMHASEIVKAPLTLMQDSAFQVESLLAELFGERMARTANDKLTLADGSSKPQGIAVGAGAGVTAASATAIAADELIDLQHTVNPAYRRSPKCAWMFNDTILRNIRKLKDSENRYIWQPPNIQLGEPGQLLGKPYWINPSMPAATAGLRPIVFGDLSKYVVRRVNGFQFFVFRERYMPALQLGFMSFGRMDGKVINTAAVKRLTMAAS
jgi:HK97 family phage major capsid protein